MLTQRALSPPLPCGLALRWAGPWEGHCFCQIERNGPKPPPPQGLPSPLATCPYCVAAHIGCRVADVCAAV